MGEMSQGNRSRGIGLVSSKAPPGRRAVRQRSGSARGERFVGTDESSLPTGRIRRIRASDPAKAAQRFLQRRRCMFSSQAAVDALHRYGRIPAFHRSYPFDRRSFGVPDVAPDQPRGAHADVSCDRSPSRQNPCAVVAEPQRPFRRRRLASSRDRPPRSPPPRSAGRHRARHTPAPKARLSRRGLLVQWADTIGVGVHLRSAAGVGIFVETVGDTIVGKYKKWQWTGSERQANGCNGVGGVDRSEAESREPGVSHRGRRHQR
mmetsp:Transcript_41136/g.86294  ORF Transcript_41136/g.86294 Transcript_41136/m.86294 type:complete len:262 (+) Transcript_41136:1551-2336(+)